MRPAMDGEIIEGQSILLFVGLNFFDWYSSSARSGGHAGYLPREEDQRRRKGKWKSRGLFRGLVGLDIRGDEFLDLRGRLGSVRLTGGAECGQNVGLQVEREADVGAAVILRLTLVFGFTHCADPFCSFGWRCRLTSGWGGLPPCSFSP